MDDSDVLFRGRRFQVVQRSQIGDDGAAHSREIVQHPGAVTILPMVDDDHICLIRNRRVAVGQTLIELPAGTLEPGEAPLVAATRELTEETGYRAGRIEALNEFWMSPGVLSERMHLFLATQLEPGPTNLDAGEQIETQVVKWKTALDMVQGGEIQDAKTLVGLLFYDKFRRGG